MQKKDWMLATLAALSLTASGAMLGVAQEGGVKVQVGPGGVQVDTPRGRAVEARAVEARTARGVENHRASKVIGMTVKNAAGEDLGKVEDLVIGDRGAVRYAAVSFGGFLGFNDKLFAVPYSALTFHSNPDSGTSHVQLNVEKKLLEKAPGFPKDQWPNFADSKFHKEVDDFYLQIGGRQIKVEEK